MDNNAKSIDPEEFKLQIQNLIQNCIATPDLNINIYIQQASKIRKQINNTPNAKLVCKGIVIQLLKSLLEIFTPKFQKKPQLEEFFRTICKYEEIAKYLNIACYHICQNLSQNETLVFWKIAMCKIILNNLDYIKQNIFKQLENLLDQIYRKQEQEFVHKRQETSLMRKQAEENLIITFQNHLEILLNLSMNEYLIEKNINVFDDFCLSLYSFLQIEYFQKYKRWFQIYSVQDYLNFVEKEFQLNQEIFRQVIQFTSFKTNYDKIMRIIYENMLYNYRNVVLNDEKGFIGLLNEFFSNFAFDLKDQKQFEVRLEIVQILRLYSIFQDQEIYFSDFKQSFQQFVRKNIEEQYKQSTLHHELEKQKSQHKSLVKILGDIYDKFQILIKMCFRKRDQYNGRYDLEMIIQSEIRLFFINLEQKIQITQKLCDYVHDLMIQMAKSDDQQQIDENYEEIRKVQSDLLPFIKDFDYYLIINNYKLASRLLSYLIFFESSFAQYHLENEQKILDQMKQFCGDKKLKKFNKMISETRNLALNKIVMTPEITNQNETRNLALNQFVTPGITDQNETRNLALNQIFITSRITDTPGFTDWSETRNLALNQIFITPGIVDTPGFTDQNEKRNLALNQIFITPGITDTPGFTNQNESKLKRKQYFSAELIQINKKKWPKLEGNDENVFQQLQSHKQAYYQQIKSTNLNLQNKIVFSDTLSFVEIFWSEVNKTLILNCVQAAILYLYDNDDKPRTFEEITAQLKLQPYQVQFQLDRMVKQKILWNDNEDYFLNDSQIQQDVKEFLIVMDRDIYENQKYIDDFKPIIDSKQDLKYQLDAQIMKILKSEKRKDHNSLFQKVSNHFYPISINNEQFKISIEFLLKYEYIKRDQKELLFYCYE